MDPLLIQNPGFEIVVKTINNEALGLRGYVKKKKTTTPTTTTRLHRHAAAAGGFRGPVGGVWAQQRIAS
jgi:hypothetical protein